MKFICNYNATYTNYIILPNIHIKDSKAQKNGYEGQIIN